MAKLIKGSTVGGQPIVSLEDFYKLDLGNLDPVNYILRYIQDDRDGNDIVSLILDGYDVWTTEWEELTGIALADIVEHSPDFEQRVYDTVEATVEGYESSSSYARLKTHMDKTDKEIEDLKSSVSSGKNEVATAITDKGVPTKGSDSFKTMADNIKLIKTSPDLWDMYINPGTPMSIVNWYLQKTKAIKFINLHFSPGQYSIEQELFIDRSNIKIYGYGARFRSVRDVPIVGDNMIRIVYGEFDKGIISVNGIQLSHINGRRKVNGIAIYGHQKNSLIKTIINDINISTGFSGITLRNVINASLSNIITDKNNGVVHIRDSDTIQLSRSFLSNLVHIQDSKNVSILENKIHGIIEVEKSSAVTILGNYMQPFSGRSSAVLLKNNSSNVIITSNVFQYHNSSVGHSIIRGYGGDMIVISNNTFTMDSRDVNGFIYITSFVWLTVSGNRFHSIGATHQMTLSGGVNLKIIGNHMMEPILMQTSNITGININNYNKEA